MNITLYTNNSEDNKISKNISELTQLEGTLREGTDIISPSILVQASSPSWLTSANYAQLPDFGSRYYYITNITLESNTIWRIDMRIDVLMTYKEQILKQKAYIKRQETEANLYLAGSDVPLLSGYVNEQKIIASNLFSSSNPTIVLVTVGKIAGD